jgi:hypothetical protein
VFQKRMGKGFCILPGNTVAQQQLQNIDLIKMIQTFHPETVLDTLSVSVMHRHIFTSFKDYSCIFSKQALK